MHKVEKLTCPRCGRTAERLAFRKLDNEDPLRNVDVYQCLECYHTFAPIPHDLLPEYHARVLGIKMIREL